MLDRGLLQSIFGSSSASAPSGYQLNEVTNLSYMQEGSCNYLEDYLIKKLKRNDPKVKFKALRLIKHLCENGNPTFKMLVQRHANQIKFCQSYKGPFDPVYGDTLSELVREEAVQCLKSIFSSSNRNDEKINVGDRSKGFGSGANESLKNNYKSRIHGFGNPNFVDNRTEQGSGTTDLSQIGSSIILNAKVGQYGQVVDDLSELVLKVLPNKLIDGISSYYGNSRSWPKPMNSHDQNKPPPSRRDFRNDFFSNEFSKVEKINLKDNHIPVYKQGNFPEPRIEENKFHYSKQVLVAESPSISSGHTLEAHFVENYCSTTGLILNPSNELLQNSLKEIQKLDVPVVIKMLHDKLIYLYNSDPSIGEKDQEAHNCGSKYQIDNHYDDDNEPNKSPRTVDCPINPKPEDKFKTIYKILCLLLYMLEKNQNTNKHLIEYVDSDFTHLLNQIASSNIHCRKRVKQITEFIGAGATHAQDTPHNAPMVELTNNLIDFDIGDNSSRADRGLCSQENFNDSLLPLSGKYQENSDKKNNLFKNLSIKSHANKGSGSTINLINKQDEQTGGLRPTESTGRSLVDLGIL